MRALTLRGAHDAAIAETDDEPLGAGDVRVAIAQVGLCGSDTHFYAHGRIGAFRLTGPHVLGHEASGTVLETGGEVTDLVPGDRVAVEPGLWCGRCRECLAGTYNLCADMRFLGMPPHAGLARERVVLPRRAVHAVPAGMTATRAALLEPLSVAVWAVGRAAVQPGEQVLIAGAGPIGTLVARVALAQKAARVIVADVDDRRLARLAESTPGVETAHVGTGSADGAGNGFQDVAADLDCYLECSGAPTALDDGMTRLRPRGRAVLVGVPAAPTFALSSTLIRYRELTLTTVHRYAHTWPRAIELVSSDAVEVDDLVSDRYRLEEGPRALAEAAAGEVAMKAMISVGAS
ncbi:L-iditol 2-dehydrogenase [Actinacidiphila alni]|uniref:L-iditol 2-dehydrogenase n=1 Tax=Actinacidiphila alni TaxID=380248 RepID=A0A1I2IC64_9ACTN|nr:alcohol dehydrogenase catalytic domain-containing protein [Actinacidiphila alni]SFF39243.1 L-iditol 2-dehydrogenase [Actinacidiphila alni]